MHDFLKINFVYQRNLTPLNLNLSLNMTILRIFPAEEQFHEHPKLNHSQIYSNDIKRVEDQVRVFKLRVFWIRYGIRYEVSVLNMSRLSTRFIQNDQIISN